MTVWECFVAGYGLGIRVGGFILGVLTCVVVVATVGSIITAISDKVHGNERVD